MYLNVTILYVQLKETTVYEVYYFYQTDFPFQTLEILRS